MKKKKKNEVNFNLAVGGMFFWVSFGDLIYIG